MSEVPLYQPTVVLLIAVERVWHTRDSQGPMLALNFRSKSFNPFNFFPLGTEAASTVGSPTVGSHTPYTRVLSVLSLSALSVLSLSILNTAGCGHVALDETLNPNP